MGEKLGRPRKGEGRPTGPTRIAKDLVAMIEWITRIHGTRSSDYLDPMIRPVVIAKYSQLLPAIKAMKDAEDAARKAAGQPPTDPLPEVVIVEVHTAPPAESEKKPKKK